MTKKITMLETRKGSPHGFDCVEYEKGATYEVPDELAAAFLESKVAVEGDCTDKKAKAGDTVTWPPTDEQLEGLGFDDLGALLTSQSADPKPLKSKDDRRAAIRDLIAKQAAEAAVKAAGEGGKGDGTDK